LTLCTGCLFIFFFLSGFGEKCASEKIKEVWVLLTLRDLNKALVGKRLCKWFEKPDLLWKQLIHQKFYAYRNILEMDSFFFPVLLFQWRMVLIPFIGMITGLVH